MNIPKKPRGCKYFVKVGDTLLDFVYPECDIYWPMWEEMEPHRRNVIAAIMQAAWLDAAHKEENRKPTGPAKGFYNYTQMYVHADEWREWGKIKK